jgi:hypothetical protein
MNISPGCFYWLAVKCIKWGNNELNYFKPVVCEYKIFICSCSF